MCRYDERVRFVKNIVLKFNLGGRSRQSGGVDVHQLPTVVVEIQEAATVHGTVVLSVFKGGGAGFQGFTKQLVHFLTTVFLRDVLCRAGASGLIKGRWVLYAKGCRIGAAQTDPGMTSRSCIDGTGV